MGQAQIQPWLEKYFSGVAQKRADKITAEAKRVTDRIGQVEKMDARDALLNLSWLERDTKNLNSGFQDHGPFLQQLQEVLSRIDSERDRVGRALQNEIQTKLAEWQKRSHKSLAEGTKGGDLLKIIDEIEDEMQALSLNCKACGVPVPDFSAAELDKLKQAYKAEYPKRKTTGEPETANVVEGSQPKLNCSEEEALAIFHGECHNDWFKLKKLFKDGAVAKEVMEQAWAYRQSIVDDYMQRVIEKQYGLKRGAGWNAVGSVTLESDIDVSILDHYWVDEGGERKIAKTDAEIVKEFNDWFLAKFKAQPGIMFDVNLYASAPPRKSLPDLENASPVQKAMASMTNAGQDVGALMKIRRYMTWEEYEAYKDDVLKAMAADGAVPKDIATTDKQFEEADSLYQISLADSLNKAKELLEKLKPDELNDEQKHALEMINENLEKAQQATGAEAQKILIHAAKELEHMADVNMWVNNELYTQGIEEVRKLELEAEELEKKITAGNLTPNSPEAKKLAGVVARLKTLFTDSVFFANEAYHSDGPFKHIVQATQGVKSDLERELRLKKEQDETVPKDAKVSAEEIENEMKARRGKLSIHLCLQSFNEQLGDLLKDLGHYAKEDNPGIGFYRSSKYLQRLLDALDLLRKKAEEKEVQLALEVGDPADLAKQVDATLLAARKGKLKFEGINAEEQADDAELEIQAYCIEKMSELFGVDTLRGLADKFKRIGAKVNGQLRKLVAAEMSAAKEQEKSYFPS